MANIIAIIWEFDKTLISNYMQTPMFEENGINATDFWKEVNDFPADIEKKGIRVNKDIFN